MLNLFLLNPETAPDTTRGALTENLFVFVYFFHHILVPPVGNSSSQSAHFGAEIVHHIAHLLVRVTCYLNGD